ncbi:hypothetical protein Sango_0169800 [Sesamum angolense]|uniref:Uncharacterized protein n=1 Tax=Sesamum angolense TaxID=2727404 RepID=A0AAE1XGI7_9LAMI|nr:hypothetical protein Sango_0169800 [Sesamum angolense]
MAKAHVVEERFQLKTDHRNPLRQESETETKVSCLVVLAKSRVPIAEAEIRQKKNDCYADIESGLWGQQCKSSIIAKENCALRCLSPVCYELIYESDPLEEGEKDYSRSSEYKYCMHRQKWRMQLSSYYLRTQPQINSDNYFEEGSPLEAQRA